MLEIIHWKGLQWNQAINVKFYHLQLDRQHWSQDPHWSARVPVLPISTGFSLPLRYREPLLLTLLIKKIVRLVRRFYTIPPIFLTWQAITCFVHGTTNSFIRKLVKDLDDLKIAIQSAIAPYRREMPPLPEKMTGSQLY